jgi:RHS repeat-associated protein
LVNTVETSGNAEKTTDFHYDNNGSQISKLVSTISDAAGDEEFTLTPPGTGTDDEITFELNAYDAFGHLVSVQNDNYIAKYEYNADGLRTSKSITQSGVTTSTKFLYESGYITLELDGSGAQTAYNVYGNDSIISRKTAQGTSYYLYNGRGDVVQLTNTWGAVTVNYDYDAFGNLMEAFIDDTNPFRYSGEYFDLCSKRYYLRSRYYDPSTGRFTQRDAYLGCYTDP